jgi:ribosomal protein S18 acetylase RimI-like enzyme
MQILTLWDIFHSYRDVLASLIDLYKKDSLPPHCYLAYDLVHEFRNIDVILGISNGEIESYILIWRASRLYGIHMWRPARDLISRLEIRPDRVAYIHLYESDEEHTRMVMLRLKEIGYNKMERRKFHNMICTEDTFSPSDKEELAIKLRPHHSELFLELKRSRGQFLNPEEAREILRKRRYYGVIADGKLVSTASRYLTLEEIHMIGDVYTRPEYRGRGYAKAVTSAITKEAIASGAIASLHVETNNEPAIRVYKSLGYNFAKTHDWISAIP